MCGGRNDIEPQHRLADQIAQSGALSEMQEIIEWQDLLRGERIF
jgi:hypothetical protein